MSESKIKVLVVEPLNPCYVQEISGLKAMQELVGGHIEAVHPFTEPAMKKENFWACRITAPCAARTAYPMTSSAAHFSSQALARRISSP